MKRAVFAGLLLCAVAAQAQEAYERLSEAPVPVGLQMSSKAGPTCTGGVVLDDGVFEDGYRIAFAPTAHFVQAFRTSGNNTLVTRACVAWRSGFGSVSPTPYSFVFFADDGPIGQPGALLAALPGAVTIGSTLSPPAWTGVDCATANINVPSRRVYAGVRWDTTSEIDLFLPADRSASTSQASVFRSSNGRDWTPISQFDSGGRAIAVRLEFGPGTTPPPPPPPPPVPDPPAGPWMTSLDMPGFGFKVRLTAGGSSRIATQVADCVEQTVCAAGVFPDRPEVFLRVIGPRSNGYLWPIVIRFTNSQVETWVQQISTGQIKYYNLGFIGPDSDELTGVNDRFGFLP